MTFFLSRSYITRFFTTDFTLFIYKIPLKAFLKSPFFSLYTTQPAFTCSKLTIETLEQGVRNMLNVNKKETIDTTMT